jgi:hypothetical protein
MNEAATLDLDLLYEARDGIGRITFNRPQAGNSLTFGMHERLAEICASGPHRKPCAFDAASHQAGSVSHATKG